VPGTLSSNKILKSNATGDGAGSFNDDNLGVGNVRPVAFGVGLTGTLANLVATDAAYAALEAARNNKTAAAADIKVGKSVTIAAVTTDGAYSLTPPGQPSFSAAPTAGDGQVTLHCIAAAPADVIYAIWRTGNGTFTAPSESFKRTGSGDLAITGLTNEDRYGFLLLTKAGDLYSLPSDIAFAIPTAGAAAAVSDFDAVMTAKQPQLFDRFGIDAIGTPYGLEPRAVRIIFNPGPAPFRESPDSDALIYTGTARVLMTDWPRPDRRDEFTIEGQAWPVKDIQKPRAGTILFSLERVETTRVAASSTRAGGP